MVPFRGCFFFRGKGWKFKKAPSYGDLTGCNGIEWHRMGYIYIYDYMYVYIYTRIYWETSAHDQKNGQFSQRGDYRKLGLDKSNVI